MSVIRDYLMPDICNLKSEIPILEALLVVKKQHAIIYFKFQSTSVSGCNKQMRMQKPDRTRTFFHKTSAL